MLKKFFVGAGLAVLLFLSVAAVKIYPFISEMSKFDVVEYDKNLTLIFGGGGNSAILVGEKEVLVIDSKIMSGKSKLFEFVKMKAGKKPIILVNTHLHRDHADGNSLYKEARIIAGAYSKEQWVEENGAEGLPTEWVKGTQEIPIGDETVVIKNVGQAHTHQDVIVFFKNRKMLFFGDILMNGMHPFLKSKNGSIIKNYFLRQNEALSEFQPKVVVPGHGKIGGIEIVHQFQAYLYDAKLVAENKVQFSQIDGKYYGWIAFPFKSGTGETVDYWKLELKKASP